MPLISCPCPALPRPCPALLRPALLPVPPCCVRPLRFFCFLVCVCCLSLSLCLSQCDQVSSIMLVSVHVACLSSSERFSFAVCLPISMCLSMLRCIGCVAYLCCATPCLCFVCVSVMLVSVPIACLLPSAQFSFAVCLIISVCHTRLRCIGCIGYLCRSMHATVSGCLCLSLLHVHIFSIAAMQHCMALQRSIGSKQIRNKAVQLRKGMVVKTKHLKRKKKDKKNRTEKAAGSEDHKTRKGAGASTSSTFEDVEGMAEVDLGHCGSEDFLGDLPNGCVWLAMWRSPGIEASRSQSGGGNS